MPTSSGSLGMGFGALSSALVRSGCSLSTGSMQTYVEAHLGASDNADFSFWAISERSGVGVERASSSTFLNGTHYSTTTDSLLGATSISSASRIAGPSSSRASGSLTTTRIFFKKQEEKEIPCQHEY